MAVGSWQPPCGRRGSLQGGKDAGIDNVPDAGVDACGARRPLPAQVSMTSPASELWPSCLPIARRARRPMSKRTMASIAEAGSGSHPVIIAVLVSSPASSGGSAGWQGPAPQRHPATTAAKLTAAADIPAAPQHGGNSLLINPHPNPEGVATVIFEIRGSGGTDHAFLMPPR
jgi:hypothetical protein